VVAAAGALRSHRPPARSGFVVPSVTTTHRGPTPRCHVLRVLLILVVVAAVVAELALPAFVEARVERIVDEHTSGDARVDADAGDFPFLPGLLMDGVVDRLDVTLREVGGQEITIGRVTMGLEGIEVDRSRLLAGAVEVVGIASGHVLVEVEEDAISEALGVPVDLDPAMVDLAGRALEVVAPGGPSLQLPVPENLLPCTPDVEVVDGVARLSCEFDEVPGVLLRALETGG
jgi:hypothetical protein